MPSENPEMQTPVEQSAIPFARVAKPPRQLEPVETAGKWVRITLLASTFTWMGFGAAAATNVTSST